MPQQSPETQFTYTFPPNTAHNLAIAYQLHLKTNNLPSQSLPLLRSTIQVYLAAAISLINSSPRLLRTPAEHHSAILQYLSKFHTLQTDSLPKSQTKQRKILQWLLLPDTLTPHFPLVPDINHDHNQPTTFGPLLHTIELIDSRTLDSATTLPSASSLKKFADVVPFDQTYFKK